ncbi:MAG: glycosyltransferase family 2 protein [Gemmatimonadaceae bacterium]
MVDPLTRAAAPPCDLCVVVPAFNEAANVEALHAEVSAALGGLGIEHAFLFVDDGSTDATADVLAKLRAGDHRVRWLRLARNFGLQGALAAGLAHADGRAVIVMDADLQDDPAALGAFVERWRGGAQVVYAVRTNRRERPVKRLLFSGFHWLMRRLADVPIPRDAGSFALYDRVVVDHINALPERNRYLPGLRAWVGFRQEGVPVERRARHAGEPGQSLLRLFSLAFDGIFAFSKAPLRLATLLGFFVTGQSAAALLVVVYWRFIVRSFPSGVGLATIALSLLFLGGVQLLVTGVIGEYLGRVYDEVKRRPHFIVADWQGVGPPSTREREG